MKEIFRSNDQALLSWVTALLRGSQIDVVELDRHTSVMEGSIGAIQCRIMVPDEDYDEACAIMRDAELEPFTSAW